MNFSDFLKQLRTQKNLATAKEHYEVLGGKSVLGISLRHFQQIESGKYPPSESLLTAVFDRVSPSDRKAVVMAYFQSVYGSSKEGQNLISYLDKHLIPAVEESRNIWNDSRRSMTYTEAQLDYLTKNTEALRLHRKLVLLEKCSTKEAGTRNDVIRELIELDLIESKGSELKPSRTLYRLPHFDNSSPRAVSKAHDYIFKLVDHYGSREGSLHQELGYGFQMVTPAAAQRILEQLRAFKRWVQAMASQETGPNVRPFLFVGFAKHLERREL